jgi:hypothetical protein
VTAAQKKELLRAVIRRVILARPRPDRIEVKVVWISGAFSVLEAHPPIHRTVDVAGYEQLVERTLALAAEGIPDGEIARRLTADGFRSARHPTSVPARLVGQVRRRHGQTSLLIQLRGQDQVDGHWTVTGLARALGVARHWIYRCIRQGRLPTVRHAATGYHLIPDDPALLATLRAEVAAATPAVSRQHHRQAVLGSPFVTARGTVQGVPTSLLSAARPATVPCRPSARATARPPASSAPTAPAVRPRHRPIAPRSPLPMSVTPAASPGRSTSAQRAAPDTLGNSAARIAIASAVPVALAGPVQAATSRSCSPTASTESL